MKHALIETRDQHGDVQDAQGDHKRRGAIAEEAKEQFELLLFRERRVRPQARHELDADLHETFGPAALLRFEGVHLDGQFRRAVFVYEVDEAPAHELRAEAEVCVFGERVVLPAA